MTDAEAETPKLLKVSERCWVRQEIDNIGWVDMGDDVLVVDALEQPQLEGEVLRLIAESTGNKPVNTVVNTHTHYDHIALNDAFARRFRADIVNMQTREIPTGGVRFGTGSREARVLPMPGCHTMDDIIVWLPGDKVLFVGDIFGWGLIPWDRPLDQEKIDHILGTYQRLIDFGPKTVVPGHGPLCAAVELERWMEYVNGLLKDIKQRCGKGVSRREISTADVPPPADMRHWWRFLKWKHEDSVKKVAQAVARGRL